MTSPKLLVALALVAVAVVHANGYLLSGHRTNHDMIFCHHETNKNPNLINWISNLKYVCTLYIDYLITEVLAVNRDQSNPDGVDVIITHGGPGHNVVHLLFKTPFFHGLNYTIDVFGQHKDFPY